MTLDQLVKDLDAMTAPNEIPLSWTKRELDAYETQRQLLQRRILIARNASAALAELDPKIAMVTKWRDHLVTWRQSLCEQLLAASPRSGRTVDWVQGLKMSISNIDRGCEYWNSMASVGPQLAELMRAAGYKPTDGSNDIWTAGFGSLRVTEQRLAELQKRRAETKQQLDAVLCDPVPA